MEFETNQKKSVLQTEATNDETDDENVPLKKFFEKLFGLVSKSSYFFKGKRQGGCKGLRFTKWK